MTAGALITKGLGAAGRVNSIVHRGLASAAGLPEPPPAGFQYATSTTTTIPPGGLSLQQNAVPAIVVGDVSIVSLQSDPGGYDIDVNGDGTLVIHSNGDRSRQHARYQYFRPLTGAIDDPLTDIWIDEFDPIWSAAISLRVQVGVPITPFDCNTLCTSPAGDTLTFALASGALPPGNFNLSAAGILTGAATVAGVYPFTVNATDSTGTAVASPASTITATGTGPTTVPVPNVVGDTSAAATTAITGASLLVGAITQASSDTVAVGVVLSQVPAAGAVVNTGSIVSYVLSSGPAVPNPPSVLVPQVVGLTQDKAQATLAGVGLTLGTAKADYDN